MSGNCMFLMILTAFFAICGGCTQEEEPGFQEIRKLVQNDDIEALRALRSRGVDLARVDEWGSNLMFDARTAKMIKYLASEGVLAHQQRNEKTNKETPLHNAVIASNISPEVVQSLIEEGADLEAEDRFGKTAQDYAEQLSGFYPDVKSYKTKFHLLNDASTGN